MSKHQFHPSGQSILEVILAATLISIGLIAALSLATTSQRSADFSKNNNLATNYNYQVVDWLREVRTRDGWESLIYNLQEDSGGNSVTYCLNDSLPSDTASFAALVNESNCSASVIVGTVFSRQLDLELSGLPETLSGSVTTSWPEKEVRQNILEFELTKWQ